MIQLCPSGKFAYADEGYARVKLVALGCKPDGLHRKGVAPARMYRCPKCGWWHLTSRR